MAKSNITEDGNGINHQQREVLKQRYQKLRLLTEAMTEIYTNPCFEDNYPGLMFLLCRMVSTAVGQEDDSGQTSIA